MKTYNIKKIYSAPDWGKIEKLNIDVSYFNTPENISAYGQLCFTDEAILVHLVSVEDSIRAEETGLLGSPCDDSCLEFFFCPVPGDSRYFNIEFNSNGCMYLGLASCAKTLIRLFPEREKDKILNPKINITQNGWEIFYTVPFEFIRRFFPDFKAEDGIEIRANCSKVAEATVPQQFLSWNKITDEPFTFHHPQSFGCMKFIK